MVYTNDASWRPLYMSRDALQAGAVATSIASMWFDVHLTDRHGRPVEHDDDRSDIGEYVVRVLEADFVELIDVLDEIIEEQTSFDEMLNARTDRLGVSQRRLLIGLIIVVSALAATGAIEL